MDTRVELTETSAAAVDWVGRVRALRPLLEAASPRIDEDRELPPDVLDALHDQGLFRLLIPRELGGAQLDLPTFFAAMEAFGQADGSVAWCVGQGSGCSITAAYLPPEAAWQMFGADRRAVLAWGAGPSGKAVRAPGGWQVTGAWSYASGSRHANWLGGLCPMFEADGTPLREADGAAMLRSFVFPKAQARVVDDWQTMGLRGTGSDSYRVDDIFVPGAFHFLRSVPAPHPGTLYRVPLVQVYPMAFAAIAQGLARSVVDSFIAMALGKTPRGGQAMRDNAAIQSILGQCETRLRASRTYILQTLRDIWASLEAGNPMTAEDSLAIRMASTFAIQEAMAVTDTLYHEAGATAIHASNPFERRFRDLHSVAQQVQGRRANFELVGQTLLGLPTGPLFF